MLRSHQLKADTVPSSCRAIARCGAGVNNVPVDEMTARGIPVFNSPCAFAQTRIAKHRVRVCPQTPGPAASYILFVPPAQR